MLSKDILDCYLKAGSIASEVRQEARTLIKEDASLLQICEHVENSIRGKGGEPAFPCNICINDIAAHYSSPPKDMTKIPQNAVVKLDLGVQVDGYVADTAMTVSLSSQYENMVFAVNEVLEQVIKNVRPKAKIDELGRTIQRAIANFGFKPIRNLSGHQMSRYILHTGKSIPNVSDLSFQSINEDEIYAIEPFLTFTSARGEVRNGNYEYIYRFQKERRVDSTQAAQLLTQIKTNFKFLPFSPRWIKEIEFKGTLNAFNLLVEKRCVSSYPVLVEASGNIVAQAEHTVIVTRDGCIVTTR